MLLAGRNPARFLRLGKVVEVEPADLFATNWPLPVEGVGTLEAYPNRNSLQYLGLYGLHDVDTMFRGTLRYPGWCRMMKTLVDLGWLDLQPPPREVETLGRLTAFLLRRQVAAMTAEEIRQGVAARFQLPPDGDTIQRLEWAGLFSDTRLATHDTILDALAEVLKEKLVYQPRERDMIALLHQFDAVDARGKKLAISSTLVDFGVPGGDSAMARTVSLPAAIAARLILEGGIRTAGVKIPVEPEIYGPVLDELARVGIV